MELNRPNKESRGIAGPVRPLAESSGENAEEYSERDYRNLIAERS
jgi:hypothetical protein